MVPVSAIDPCQSWAVMPWVRKAARSSVKRPPSFSMDTPSTTTSRPVSSPFTRGSSIVPSTCADADSAPLRLGTLSSGRNAPSAVGFATVASSDPLNAAGVPTPTRARSRLAPA